MAALFQAFLNIYHKRVEDLFRIATGGAGVTRDGDIHPDLVNRLAAEAAKSARHILTMCIRALDYVPPVDLTFGECQPHLLNLYRNLGFRSYGQTNHPQVGVLVLLVMLLGDHEHLIRLNSPMARFLVDPALTGDAAITARVLPLLDAAGVRNPEGPYSAEFWGEIYSLLEPGRRKAAHLLDNMNEAAVNAVLSGSNVIELARNDYLMRRGARTQTVYVVLQGQLEILSGDRVLGVCEDGDVIGEIAFLLAIHRTTDVRVISEHARVLSLSERSLRRLMEYNAPIAATLLYNLCRSLAYRLVARTSG